MIGEIYDLFESPVGELLLLGDGESLCGLRLQRGEEPHTLEAGWQRSRDAFDDARAQLDEYFAGRRRVFDLSVSLRGTAFQRLAWRALTEIAYGVTRTYAEQAARIGRPSAVRAVGAANGRNPIPIIVPCHRVIGHDGSLTGFGGGLKRKRYLLEHEAAIAAQIPRIAGTSPAATASARRR